MLFVCSDNAARSQMAEALLRDMAGDRCEVYSAGTAPQPAVHPLAVEAMREVGVDITGAVPRDVRRFVGQPFDLVVTVCERARGKCPVFPSPACQEHWGFDDPGAAPGGRAERLAAFRRVRERIRERLEQWLAQVETR